MSDPTLGWKVREKFLLRFYGRLSNIFDQKFQIYPTSIIAAWIFTVLFRSRELFLFSPNLRNPFEKISPRSAEEKPRRIRRTDAASLPGTSRSQFAQTHLINPTSAKVRREVNNVVRYSRLWKSVKRSLAPHRRERNIYLFTRRCGGRTFRFRLRSRECPRGKFSTMRRMFFITYSRKNKFAPAWFWWSKRLSYLKV